MNSLTPVTYGLLALGEIQNQHLKSVNYFQDETRMAQNSSGKLYCKKAFD